MKSKNSNSKKEDLNNNNRIITIMVRIQEYIAGTISIIGFYLILVWLSLFEYTLKLQEIFPNKGSLLFFGLILFFTSNIISPEFWTKIIRALRR